MSRRNRNKSTDDTRPVYVSPRVMRLGDVRAGAGLCQTPGSGDVGQCDNPGNSAVGAGGWGAGCFADGNNADLGTATTGGCFAVGNSATGTAPSDSCYIAGIGPTP